MKRLAIIGAGGHGRVAADTARAAGWQEIVFLDVRWPELQQSGDWPVVGGPAKLSEGRSFCAIGNNAARARVFEELGLDDSPIIVHPSAVLSSGIHVGAGTLIVAGAIVNFGAELGRGVILNTGCSVDHDCRLADFVHVAPGARLAGGVTVGERSWIGLGAVVREGIRIGADVVVGAGAAVIADVPDGVCVGGVPARPLRAEQP